MHELGIMSSAIAAALEEMRRRNATTVHRMVLRIGALSGVEPDSLRFAFEAAAGGTAAAGATLEIQTVPVLAYCAACAADFDGGAGYICECPRCRAISSEIRQGRELELARLEMS